jgi:ABC-type taurine transport system substrate-binding protein
LSALGFIPDHLARLSREFTNQDYGRRCRHESRTVPLLVAQEQGLFAKNGIEARIVLIKGAPTLVASLISGDIEVGYTGGTAVVGAAAQGVYLNSLVYLEQAHSYVDRKPEYQNGRKPVR